MIIISLLLLLCQPNIPGDIMFAVRWDGMCVTVGPPCCDLEGGLHGGGDGDVDLADAAIFLRSEPGPREPQHDIVKKNWAEFMEWFYGPDVPAMREVLRGRVVEVCLKGFVW